MRLNITSANRTDHNRTERNRWFESEVKRRWFGQMIKKCVPKQRWDYGCEVMSLTANSSFALEGRTPLEQLTGETPDVSEYLDFGFYDWKWYKDNTGVGDNMFGRWLGVSHRVGNLMSYWILTTYGRVISQTTVQQVANLEMTSTEVKQRMHKIPRTISGITQRQQPCYTRRWRATVARLGRLHRCQRREFSEDIRQSCLFTTRRPLKRLKTLYPTPSMIHTWIKK